MHCMGNPLIRELGSKILVGTWNEKLDFTAYSGFFVFSDRHKSELPKKKLPNEYRFGNAISESIFSINSIIYFLQPFRSFPPRDGEETDFTTFLPRYGAETDLYVFLSPHGDKMKSGVYSWIFYEIKQPSLERR